MNCQCGSCTCGGADKFSKPKVVVMGFSHDPILEQTIRDELLDWMAEPVTRGGDAAITVVDKDSRIAPSLLPLVKSNAVAVALYGGSDRNSIGAAVLEALGMGIAQTANARQDSITAVKHLMIRLEKGIRTRDLLTPQAFEKAKKILKLRGGSTTVTKQLNLLASYIQTRLPE